MEINLSGLQGLDDFDWGSLATKFTDVVQKAAPAVLAAKQQRDLQKLNVQRASQGMPAIDTAKYAEQSAPVVRVQGGVDASTRNLMWGLGLGGLALLGVIGYAATRPRRRSN